MNPYAQAERIIICNLDSTYSGVSLHRFFSEHHSRIVGICSSQRFGKKYGSFLKQTITSLRISGYDFTTYMSLHLVWFKIVAHVASFVHSITGTRQKVYTLQQLAKKYDIPLLYTNDPRGDDVVAWFKQKKPDLIISAYFDHIIRREIFSIPRLGVVNVHTALLPQYRGPHPALWPMFKREPYFGVTIHTIESEKFDVGEMLLQERVTADYSRTLLEIDCDMYERGVNLLCALVRDEHLPLLHTQQVGGSYFKNPTKEDVKRASHVRLYSYTSFLSLFF